MKSLFARQLEDMDYETKLRDDLFKIMFADFMSDHNQDKYKGFQHDDEGRVWPHLSETLWRCVDDIMKAR